MDIPVEPMDFTQVPGNPYQTLHRIIGIPNDSRTQKQSLDVIPTIKLNRQIHQFGYGKSGTRQVITTPVDTIGAIINAIIGKHDLQKRNTPPVFRKTMANTPSAYGVTQRPRLVGTNCTTGSTRYIVFGRFSQYFKFLKYVRIHNPYSFCIFFISLLITSRKL